MKKNGKLSLGFSYIKMLLPAILVAVLVLEALCLYEAPEIGVGNNAFAQATDDAATIPVLKLKKQKAKEKKDPAGSGIRLPETFEDADLKDGVFTGRGKGFGGDIVVRVTIKNGNIVSISVVSATGEDQPYFGKARAIIPTILKKQSTNVDAVSGATYSSNGIISAVRDALSKAAADKKKAAEKHKAQTQARENRKRDNNRRSEKKPKVITAGDWKDGTYTGCGNGFNGKIYIRLTINGGKITKIIISKSSDDAPYISNARRSIIPAVIAKQGTGVDTVTGATYSSVGILDAINDALRKAAKKPAAEDDDNGNEDPGGSSGGENSENDDPNNGPEVKFSKILMVCCDEDEDFENYQLAVTFVIRNGAITGITDVAQITEEPSNDSYVRAAVNGIMQQIKTDPFMQRIDTVSGATCTASALIAGGQDALGEFAAMQDVNK